MTTTTTKRNAQQEAAIGELHSYLKPKSNVFSVWRHTSASGMTRWFDFYTIIDNEPIRLTYLMCVACGYKYDTKREALKTEKAWEAVYSLGLAMWPQGTPEPHGTRNGKPDSNGGYALNHRSMG